MRIMALNAIHSAFDHGMMLRQLELRVNVHMAGKTCLRIAARIYNMPSAAAGLHVQAARPVARFASSRVAVRGAFDVQTRVGT